MGIARYLSVNIFKANNLDEATEMIVNVSAISSTGVQLLVEMPSKHLPILKECYVWVGWLKNSSILCYLYICMCICIY